MFPRSTPSSFPVILLLTAVLCAWLPANAQQQLFEWTLENPDLASIAVMEDGVLVVEHMAQTQRPSAEGVFLLLAAYFAQQAADDVVDPELLVPLDEVARYSLPSLDGASFVQWRQSTKGADGEEPDHVPLWMVAEGMMRYKSPANAEYLMRLWGKETCESLPRLLGLERHDPIFPIQAARLAHLGLDLPPHKKSTHLKDLSAADYRHLAWAWSDSLAEDYEGRWSSQVQNLDLSLQRVWSNRLPGGTMQEYAQLAEQLRSRQGWSEDATAWLERLTDQNQDSSDPTYGTLERIGGMNGMSLYNYHHCRYLHTEDGRHLALAINLQLRSPDATRAIGPAVESFEQQVVQNPEFLGPWKAQFAVDGE